MSLPLHGDRCVGPLNYSSAMPYSLAQPYPAAAPPSGSAPAIISPPPFLTRRPTAGTTPWHAAAPLTIEPWTSTMEEGFHGIDDRTLSVSSAASGMLQDGLIAPQKVAELVRQLAESRLSVRQLHQQLHGREQRTDRGAGMAMADTVDESGHAAMTAAKRSGRRREDPHSSPRIASSPTHFSRGTAVLTADDDRAASTPSLSRSSSTSFSTGALSHSTMQSSDGNDDDAQEREDDAKKWRQQRRRVAPHHGAAALPPPSAQSASTESALKQRHRRDWQKADHRRTHAKAGGGSRRPALRQLPPPLSHKERASRHAEPEEQHDRQVSHRRGSVERAGEVRGGGQTSGGEAVPTLAHSYERKASGGGRGTTSRLNSRLERWQRRYYLLLNRFTAETARRDAELLDIRHIIEHITLEQDQLCRGTAAAATSPSRQTVLLSKTRPAGVETAGETPADPEQLPSATASASSNGGSAQHPPAHLLPPPSSVSHHLVSTPLRRSAEATMVIAAAPAPGESTPRHCRELVDGGAAVLTDEADHGNLHLSPISTSTSAARTGDSGALTELQKELKLWKERCLTLLQEQSIQATAVMGSSSAASPPPCSTPPRAAETVAHLVPEGQSSFHSHSFSIDQHAEPATAAAAATAAASAQSLEVPCRCTEGTSTAELHEQTSAISAANRLSSTPVQLPRGRHDAASNTFPPSVLHDVRQATPTAVPVTHQPACPPMNYRSNHDNRRSYRDAAVLWHEEERPYSPPPLFATMPEYYDFSRNSVSWFEPEVWSRSNGNRAASSPAAALAFLNAPPPLPPPLSPSHPTARMAAAPLQYMVPGLSVPTSSPAAVSPADVVATRAQLDRDIRRHDQLLAAIGKLQRTAADYTVRRP